MYASVVNVLNKFANNCDLKDWHSLSGTLMDTIECDYRDLRGECKTYSKEEYIDARKRAWGHLKTHHLFSNLEVVINLNSATCQVSAIIYRQNDERKYFNSHVIYQFELQEKDDVWKIKKIKQSVLWNEGDVSIHRGVWKG